MAPIAVNSPSSPPAAHEVIKPEVVQPEKVNIDDKEDAPANRKQLLYDPLRAVGAASLTDEPDYKWNDYKPSFPKVDWAPLEPVSVTDRGHSAPSLGKNKKENTILTKASKYKFLTPALGVDIEGINLNELTDGEKDDLALLAAQVGVVIIRDNEAFTVEDQLTLGRHYGPLHKHHTTGVPKVGGLDEIHLVYADQESRPDPTAFAKEELYHSDVTYELQPPAITSLRLLSQPSVGGDTIFSSGQALYASFSPAFQTYLETLSAVHSGVAQSNGAKAAGHHPRREAVEHVHPVVRVHPVTGIKSIFVNNGFTRRIVGVPKPESDAILALLFKGFVVNADFQTRARWEPGTVVFWDNRIVNHSALFDFYPERRHGVRVTPTGERPLSVEAYEKEYNTKAKDWAVERAKELRIKLPAIKTDDGKVKERGFKD